MRRILSMTLAFGVVLSVCSITQATIEIKDLYNTGEVTAAGLDTKYMYTTVEVTPVVGAAVVSDPKPGTWVANDGDSQWISTNAISRPSTYQTMYKTSFLLRADPVGGDDLSTIVLSGKWSTDDDILDVLINGTSISETLGGPNVWTALWDFAFSGGAGLWNVNADPTLWEVNTIEFLAQNTHGGVSGLRIDSLGSNYPELRAVPEPASLAVWALLSSILGLGILRRRRKTS
jgi:hypothetical protein